MLHLCEEDPKIFQKWFLRANIYVFKINKTNIRRRFEIWYLHCFWCLYCSLWIYFTLISIFCIVEFEQVTVCWVRELKLQHKNLKYPILREVILHIKYLYVLADLKNIHNSVQANLFDMSDCNYKFFSLNSFFCLTFQIRAMSAARVQVIVII